MKWQITAVSWGLQVITYNATAQQQQSQPHIESASDATPHSMSPNGHSTLTTQNKKAPKCTILV